MSANRAFPKDRAEDKEARRRFPSVWLLILPYWKTKQGLQSLAMLACVLVGGWVGTYASLWLNRWTGTFYDAIGAQKFVLLPALLTSFIVVAVLNAAQMMLAVALQSVVEFRWRKWLTNWITEKWLERRFYYRIERDGALENIDQRVADDVRLFVHDSLLLTMGVLDVPVRIITFAIVLWNIGGGMKVTLGGSTYTVAGYLVFAAVVYQVTIFLFTHLLGRRAITLNAKQNRLEGDFRVRMVRVREFAEQIAFLRGEQTERQNLSNSLNKVISNLFSTLWITTRVAFFTNTVGHLGSIVPTLLVLPRLMGGNLTLGGLMQSNSAFGSLTGALSFFPQVYLGFASWRAEANRLREFLAVEVVTENVGFVVERGESHIVRGCGLLLTNADGLELARVPDFTVSPGSRCIVRGRSGSGKSTLLRALAGLWPHGQGTITIPSSGMFFVPQRSYMPSGTLKAVVTYPEDESAFRDEECVEVLRACGLSAYVDSLNVVDRWDGRFSGGEQQRIAFARVLLAKPNVLFLDECTSALDSQSERELYTLLLSSLPDATILSVAHRRELAELHEMAIDFSSGSTSEPSEPDQNGKAPHLPFEDRRGLEKMPC
ncbi:ABC transporter ATP-binding protein/permease [Paraburkholderia sp. XV]|uniref:ABC transporter ATP-binding protein/permease n=1 Tax=Paraburkholderia sp. XV TaxID=2831520 RepID=UPI001CD56889|nr:ABC transporter ATP-binding protein/permease [Paraburkholderia sp. XV]